MLHKYFQVGDLYKVTGDTLLADGTIVKVTKYSSTIESTVTVKSTSTDAFVYEVEKINLKPYMPSLWAEYTDGTPEEIKMVELLTTPDNHKTVVDNTLKGIPYEDRFNIKRGFKYTILTPKTMKDSDVLPVIIAHTDISKGVKTPTLENLQFNSQTKVFYSKTGLGADDRAGCFVIGELIKNTKINAIYLFTDEEEIGCIGANTFCATDDYKSIKKVASCFISVDRRRELDGSSSIATYGFSSELLEKEIVTQTKRKVVRGSTTDCKVLSSKSEEVVNKVASGIACVNFSCGYENEHTVSEKLYMTELLDTIKDLTTVLTSGKLNELTFEYANPVHTYSYETYQKPAKSSTKSSTKSSFSSLLYEALWVNGVYYDETDVEKLLHFYKVTTGKGYTTKAKIYEPTIDDIVGLKANISKGTYGGIKVRKEHIKLLKGEDFCVTYISSKTPTVDLVGLITKVEITSVPIAILQEIDNYIEKGDFDDNIYNH